MIKAIGYFIRFLVFYFQLYLFVKSFPLLDRVFHWADFMLANWGQSLEMKFVIFPVVILATLIMLALMLLYIAIPQYLLEKVFHHGSVGDIPLKEIKWWG